MDRYGANWDIVSKGWETHVLGKGRSSRVPGTAIEMIRKETGAIDQDLQPFVIAAGRQTGRNDGGRGLR